MFSSGQRDNYVAQSRMFMYLGCRAIQLVQLEESYLNVPNVSVLFGSLAVLDPRVDHTVDVLSSF